MNKKGVPVYGAAWRIPEWAFPSVSNKCCRVRQQVRVVFLYHRGLNFR